MSGLLHDFILISVVAAVDAANTNGGVIINYLYILLCCKSSTLTWVHFAEKENIRI